MTIFIVNLLVISSVNIIGIFGVGYLLILHIYLQHNGITTYQYILKSTKQRIEPINKSETVEGDSE